jgi:mRNA-degrading endonuclease RelE of RelBE toxin-antitoxin system
MKEYGPPYRIDWLDAARADIRAIDRAIAMQLFEGILRFARTGAGDIKNLHGDLAGASRLRLGDYRILFILEEDAMRIFEVTHRKDAYR